jgi:hypothetical protein
MPPIPPEQVSPYPTGDEPARRFLTGPQLLARYNISNMALWRWLHDPALQFPPPTLRIKDRRYWAEDALIAWERAAASRQSQRRDRPRPPQRRRRHRDGTA